MIISPLTKLTNKVAPAIEEIGSPEKLILSFGPYMTGDTIDVDNDVARAPLRPAACVPRPRRPAPSGAERRPRPRQVSAKSNKVAGQTYYTYELFTPLALSGAHNLAALTFKGNVSILFVASADEKQWPAAEANLRKARRLRRDWARDERGVSAPTRARAAARRWSTRSAWGWPGRWRRIREGSWGSGTKRSCTHCWWRNAASAAVETDTG